MLFYKNSLKSLMLFVKFQCPSYSTWSLAFDLEVEVENSKFPGRPENFTKNEIWKKRAARGAAIEELICSSSAVILVTRLDSRQFSLLINYTSIKKVKNLVRIIYLHHKFIEEWIWAFFVSKFETTHQKFQQELFNVLDLESGKICDLIWKSTAVSEVDDGWVRFLI